MAARYNTSLSPGCFAEGAALFLPIAVAGLGLLQRRAVKIVAAFLMLAFALIGGFSVGLFYLPVAFLMLFAAFRRSPLPEDPPQAPMSDDEFWKQRL